MRLVVSCIEEQGHSSDQFLNRLIWYYFGETKNSTEGRVHINSATSCMLNQCSPRTVKTFLVA